MAGKDSNNNVPQTFYKSWSIIRVRQIQKLRTDTRHCLFPAPLGIALILFGTRSYGAFMSTCLNVVTRLGTEVYFPILSMGAGRHPCGALVYIPGIYIYIYYAFQHPPIPTTARSCFTAGFENEDLLVFKMSTHGPNPWIEPAGRDKWFRGSR